MKNKKGLSETTVVVLIIGLLTLAVLVGVGYTISKGISSVGDKAAVQNWVLLKASKLGSTQGGINPPIAMLYGDSIKINTEEQLKTEGNKLIADAMVDCWSAFDNGQTDFMSNIKIPGRDETIDPFCFPCARIEFDQSLKDGNHDLINFQQFLRTEKPLISTSTTYADILTNLIYFPTPEAKQKQKYIIPKDRDYYIFFASTKKETWAEIIHNNFDSSFPLKLVGGAVAGAGIGGAGCLILVVTAPIAAACAAAGAGGGEVVTTITTLLYKGEETFKPALILGTRDDINKVCNLEQTDCESCGDGTTNPCDKKECQDLADKTGMSCWYDDGYTYNNCFSQRKEKTEELKSANPIQTTTSTTTPITDIKITSEQCKASTGSSEMKALLDAIAWAEGANYNTMFGGKTFSDFSSHPVYTGEMPSGGFPFSGGTSTAAGRYQFLKKTYDSLKNKGFFKTGFTPEEQDKAAINLITSTRKLTEEQLKQAVETNNLRPVWDKLEQEWASIPTSSGKSYYGQPAKSEKDLNSVYYQCYSTYTKTPEPLLT